MKQYDDASKMPFGKHRGKLLIDIPMSYFNWLWDTWNEKSDLKAKLTEDTEEGALARYIRSARKAEGKGDS